MRITERETSPRSRWSLRLALFAAQLIIVTTLLHRFETLTTPVAINLVIVSLVAAAIAMLLAVLAFSQIWNQGIKGSGLALSALIIGLLVFAVPLYHLPSLIKLPAINDITTDLLSPPRFHKIAALRAGANSADYPGDAFIAAQARAYPDISTLMLERSNSDAYDLVHGVIEDLGWQIVSEKQPGTASGDGYIEAVDHSRLLGFRDDIIVRIKGDKRFARIDMRSASRYGRHDLGSNANRIREMFAVIKTRIARAEAKRVDNEERRRIARKTQEEKKRKQRERLKQQKDKNREPLILPKANFDQVGIETTPETAEPSSQNPGLAPPLNNPERAISGDSPLSQTNSQASRTRVQKIRRSKRKKHRKKWIPFEEWP